MELTNKTVFIPAAVVESAGALQKLLLKLGQISY